MKIFIQMGYVTRRRGAKLHLDVDGFASCKSGGSRIIGSGELDEASATRICRRCERALRTYLSWRADDLNRSCRSRRSTVHPERVAIEDLLDGLDELRSPAAEAREQEMLDGIRANFDKLIQQVEPMCVNPFTMEAPVVSNNQTSLF